VTTGAHDLIGIVESFYTPGLSDEAWLRLVAGQVQPLIDRYSQGVIGGMYSCPDPCSFAPSHALLCDVPDAIQAVFFEVIRALSPIHIADSFLTRTCYLSSAVRGYSELPYVRSGASQANGVVDVLQLNVVEPDGEGCWFGSAQRESSAISDDLYLTLTRVARHLCAAHRLRKRHPQTRVSPNSAEAILDQGGRIQEATGVANEPSSQSVLVRAVRSMNKVRNSRRASIDPQAAIKEWQSVIAKRWTLVEHFENDGKRFVLAVDNRAKAPSLDLLSERERDVVLRALRGCNDKVIAFELGVAQSTVRVLWARAAAKVGARSRRHLLEKVASNIGTDGTPVRND
jgi:DNA-binding NarL/FixJ family response regulator